MRASKSPDVAAVMNALFVNIKVDREERPDVDAIYMQALQLWASRAAGRSPCSARPTASRSGAAPISRTEPRYGRPASVDVLQGVAQSLSREAEDVEKNRAGLSARCARALSQAVDSRATAMFPPACSTRIADRLVQECDQVGAASAGARNSPQPASSSCCGAAGCATGGEPRCATR